MKSKNNLVKYVEFHSNGCDWLRVHQAHDVDFPNPECFVDYLSQESDDDSDWKENEDGIWATSQLAEKAQSAYDQDVAEFQNS